MKSECERLFDGIHAHVPGLGTLWPLPDDRRLKHGKEAGS